MSRRPPKKSSGFSWGRFPMGDTGVVSYRLFRRDLAGQLHIHLLDFRGESRQQMARRLATARHELRNRVDERARGKNPVSQSGGD